MTSGSTRQLFRSRDYRLLWAGQTTSLLGTSMSTFAFPLVAYLVSGSAAHAGWVGASVLVGGLALRLPAGVFADRYNRRALLLLATGVEVALFAALTALLVFDRLTMTHLVGVGLVVGGTGAIYAAAESSALRTIVPAELLPAAMGQNQARQHAASLAGPPLAGMAYSRFVWIPFLTDAISSLIAFVTTLRLSTPLPGLRTNEQTGFVTDLRAGVAFLFSSQTLRSFAMAAVVINLGFMTLLTSVILTLVAHRTSPETIGLVSGLAAGAALLGSLAASPIADRIPSGRLVIGSLTIAVALAAPAAATTNPWVLGLCLAGAMSMAPAANVVIMGYLMAITPHEMQGRVNSTLSFVAMAMGPLGTVLAGYAVEGPGSATAVLAGAGTMLVGVLLLTSDRTARQLPLPKEWVPTSALRHDQ